MFRQGSDKVCWRVLKTTGFYYAPRLSYQRSSEAALRDYFGTKATRERECKALGSRYGRASRCEKKFQKILGKMKWREKKKEAVVEKHINTIDIMKHVYFLSILGLRSFAQTPCVDWRQMTTGLGARPVARYQPKTNVADPEQKTETRRTVSEAKSRASRRATSSSRPHRAAPASRSSSTRRAQTGPSSPSDARPGRLHS